MPSEPCSEQPFPSTTFVWKKTKIKQRPAGQSTVRRRRSGFLSLARWPRTRPLRLTVTYRGGAEAWWLVEARGVKQHFPGHLALEDVLSRCHSER